MVGYQTRNKPKIIDIMKHVGLLFALLFSAVTNGLFAQEKLDLYKSKDHPKTVKISEIAEKVVYIPLETTDQSLLSETLEIYYGKNDIFVGDQDHAVFYRFNKQGKFLNQIGRKGEGPGEYPSAIHFYVDEGKSTVSIISPKTRTIYQYNYEGQFVGKIAFPESPWMITLQDGQYLFYNQRFNRISNDPNVSELFLADASGQIVKQCPTTIQDKEMDMLLFESPFFYTYNQKNYYKNPLLDQVFEVKSPLQLVPAYEIYTGPQKRTKNDMRNPQNLLQQVSVRHIVETDQLRVVIFAHQNKFHNAIYRKSDASFVTTKNQYPGFAEDLTGGPDFTAYWMGYSRQPVLLSLLTAERIEQQADRFKKAVAAEPALATWKPEDNPILVVAFLR